MMNEFSYNLKMRRLMAAWSDDSRQNAARFADRHRNLLPRPITHTQLYGLANVVRSAHCFADIQRFIQHQSEKAERAGRQDVTNYWQEMEQVLSNLRSDARELQQRSGLFPPTMNPEQTLDGLHRQLAEEFVQHLIAHSWYWSPFPKRG